MLPNTNGIKTVDSSISKHISDYHVRYRSLINRFKNNEITESDCMELESSLTELLGAIILGEVMPTITRTIAKNVDVNSIDIPTYQADELKKVIAQLSSLSMDAILEGYPHQS